MPAWADFCELDLVGEHHVTRVVAGSEPAVAARRERQPLPFHVDRHPVVAVLAGGPPRMLDLAVPEDEPLFGPADDPTTARSLGVRTALVVPVPIAGRVSGCLALGRGAARRFSADDLAVAVDLGRRIGLAWHHGVLLAERASILASLNDGLVVTDADGVVTEVNQRWTEITGYDVADSVGTGSPYPWLPDPAANDDLGEPVEASSSRVLGGGRIEARLVLRRADGTTFPALVSSAPMIDPATGARRGLVTSVKDLTVREAAQRDLAALQRVTARLAAARDVADVVAATLTAVVQRPHVDAVFLTRLSADGQRLEYVGSDGVLAGMVADHSGLPVDRAVPGNVAVRDGRTVVVGSGEALAHRYHDVIPEVRYLGVSSVLAAPVLRHGEPVGVLTVCSRRPAAFHDRDVEFFESVAGQYGQALQRAEGHELQRRASQALQGRLLADVPVVHERATIVTRYRPASVEVAVGGDWYDVVPLDGDRLAVVVGDVVGNGVDAAAVMGQLRSGLKGVALASAEPVAVLEALDRLAEVTGGAAGATVCYALVDLAAGEVRFSRAGHPPPLLVDGSAGDRARFLEGAADPPLGLRLGGRRRESVERFSSGDVLFLYTDGLVERRDAGLEERLEVLRRAASSGRHTAVEELVDDIVSACVADGGLADDLAVIAVRDEPAAPDRFRAVLPALPRELSSLRRRLGEWLLDQGFDERMVDDVVLATSEAATNAIEHAYRELLGTQKVVGVVATMSGDCVRVEVRDAGRWKARPSTTIRGRGLAISRALLGEVDVRTGPSGTAVSFTACRTSPRTTAR